MLLDGDIGYIAEALNHYRSHPENVRTGMFAHHEYVLEALQIVSEISRRVQIPRRARALAAREMRGRWHKVGLCGREVIRGGVAIHIWREVGRVFGPMQAVLFWLMAVESWVRGTPGMQRLFSAGRALCRACRRGDGNRQLARPQLKGGRHAKL
jgi:hypothetical protein